MATHCLHQTTSYGRALPYDGPVSRDENPAAHGNVRHVETCRACGAERNVLINGRHTEEGPWGASLAARQAVARRELAEARSGAPTPLTLYRGDGAEISVRVDVDGSLCTERDSAISLDEQTRALAVLPEGFVAAAQRLRAAHLAAEKVRCV